MGGKGLTVVTPVISWFYISKWGRRDIWLYGFYMLVVVLFIIGILACVPNQTVAIAWAQSCLCLVWLGAYSMSVGPIVYTIVAEIGSTRMRTQTVVLGRATYYVGNIIGGVLQPYFMSPTSWNAKGKTVGTPSRLLFHRLLTFSAKAFFWGSLSFLTTVWGKLTTLPVLFLTNQAF
jgi:SP family general alpha glucoside:H+ symporter-like MFS transporter